MKHALRRLAAALCVALVLTARAADSRPLPPLLARGVDPRTLSSGLYYALVADGHLGGIANPRAEADAAIDVNKGRAPLALDARVGNNTRLGADPAGLPGSQRGQAEPHLWRSAASPDTLVATFQEGRYASGGGSLDCGYGISTDGGLTWSRALIPSLTTSSGGTYLRATDPVAAIDLNGNVFINTLAARQPAFADGGAVVVSRSLDGGATFSAPVTVAAAPDTTHSYDKNWLAVNDYAGTPNANRLVAAFADIYGNNFYDLYASVSDDRGATWSAPALIKPHDTIINQSVQPVFLPDGSLLVPYVAALTDTGFRIECKRSLDGGRTFPGSPTVIVPNVTRFDDPVLRHGSFLITAWVARQSGAAFVVYNGRDSAGSPRVFVSRSLNNGVTWSAPVVASDNPANISVVNPAIAASPDGQRVTVTYYDKRNAAGGAYLIDLYSNTSFDGGVTWQPGLRLTEYSSDVRVAALTSSGYMLGDYQGLVPPVSDDQPAVALTIDTRNADADPFAIRYALSTTQDFAAWRIARFNRSELANDGISGLFGDPDQDGFPNFAEYALATDPRVSESGNALRVAPVGGSSLVAIDYVVRTTKDFSVQFSTSTDLATWQPLSPDTVLAPQPPGVTSPTTTRAGGIFTFAADKTTYVKQVFRPTTPPTTDVETPERALINGTSRLVNVSTRGVLKTGDSQLIAGFVTAGGARDFLIRGVGPTLGQFGVTGFATDPAISVQGTASAPFTAQNNDWSAGTTASVDALRLAATRSGATPLAEGSKDAALLVTSLSPGIYTVPVSNTGTGTVGLAEVYDLSATTAPGRLANLSTRGEVGTGENALIAGFVIAGTQPRRVLIRAVGPALTAYGITRPLADPVLTLTRARPSGAQLVAQNDDWSVSRTGAGTLASTMAQVGAFPLSNDSFDAALLLTLEPGVYSAQVSGYNGLTGIAIVEVYDAN